MIALSDRIIEITRELENIKIQLKSNSYKIYNKILINNSAELLSNFISYCILFKLSILWW